MMWYESYPKNKPFYSRSHIISNTFIHKMYFRGWIKADKGKVHIINTNGGIIKYDPILNNVYPEENLNELKERIMDAHISRVNTRINTLKDQLDQLKSCLDGYTSDSVEIIDCPGLNTNPEMDVSFLTSLGELHLAE